MSEGLGLFESGTRAKVRFEYRGLISIEDLWDLKLTELNGIAVKLYKQQRDLEEVSFIEEQSTQGQEVTLKLEIVKRVIEVKKEEKEAARVQVERRAQKQKLMELIEQKQNEQLGALSLEELKAQLDQL